jgi:hypothetical protein
MLDAISPPPTSESIDITVTVRGLHRWKLAPVIKRSRDNLPNPTTGADPYKPTNGPAIDDLMDLFKFQ